MNQSQNSFAVALDFERQLNKIIEAVTVTPRKLNRLEREARVQAAPRWLADLFWPFPTPEVRSRPFDWSHDEADIPVQAPDLWHCGDRRRFKLYLRPAEAVVQR